MIPSEILIKIRQIEIRTDWLVSEMAAFLFQPSPQFLRIARAVENGNNTDKFRFDVEIHTIPVENLDSCHTNRSADQQKSLWVLKNALESRVNFGLKSVSQSRCLLIVPVNRRLKFNAGLSFENYFPAKTRFLFDLALRSARTFSHVIPLSGWRRSLSARSSKVAICSGVNTSPNSSRMRWTTSHFSSNDIRRNCSRISVALMRKPYPINSRFATRDSHDS
jgi:hypothetical protein